MIYNINIIKKIDDVTWLAIRDASLDAIRVPLKINNWSNTVWAHYNSNWNSVWVATYDAALLATGNSTVLTTNDATEDFLYTL